MLFNNHVLLDFEMFKLGLISGKSTGGSGSLVFNDGESLAISAGQLQAASNGKSTGKADFYLGQIRDNFLEPNHSARI